MTRKELEGTVIVTGLEEAYVAVRTEKRGWIGRIRRRITEDEIVSLMFWYLTKKFAEEDCDDLTISRHGHEIKIKPEGSDELPFDDREGTRYDTMTWIYHARD